MQLPATTLETLALLKKVIIDKSIWDYLLDL